MRKIILGTVMALFASASFAQAVITFNVDFNRVLQGSGANVPNLYDSVNDPSGYVAYGFTPTPAPNLTGTVTLTAVASSTILTDPTPGVSNQITLNGTWKNDWGAAPSSGWDTHTYTNATYDLFNGLGEKFANDYSAAAPQPIFIGTASDGILSDHGPASLYGGTCPWPINPFAPGGNCESANPALDATDNFNIFDAGASSAVYPALANIGNLSLISGAPSYSNINAANSSSGIDHSDGLDGFYFNGQLCTGDTSPCGGQNINEGGIVRIYMTSSTGNTWYVVEGTTTAAAAVPVPAAVWLFGSALGLLGWMRRRVAA